MLRAQLIKLFPVLLLGVCLLIAAPAQAAGPVLLSPSDLDSAILALPNKPAREDALLLFAERLRELKNEQSQEDEVAALKQASQLIRIARRIRLSHREELPRLAAY